MLNENQKLAVTISKGAVLVVAGPGSGKTTVIVERVNYMINELQINARNILVITFAKMAAQEMKDRFHSKYGHNEVTFGTFHSTFFRILRSANPAKYNLANLINEILKKKFIEQVYKNIGTADIVDFVDTFLMEYTLMKNQLLHLGNYIPEKLSQEIFEKVAIEYETYKSDKNLFDFDDMLVDCYQHLKDNDKLRARFAMQYSHILIDEFQDINKVQFECIKLLKESNDEIFVVGDDDQSIYSFRGAKPEFLLNFAEHFPSTTKVILDINYRSNSEIVQKSNSVIKCNKNRYDKVMKAHNTNKIAPQIVECKSARIQVKDVVTAIEEVLKKGVPSSEIAIIYRNNTEAQPFAEELLNRNLAFKMRDNITTIYNHWITKDILAYFRLAYDRSNADAFQAIANKPSRYIPRQIILNLRNFTLSDLIQSDTLKAWQKEKLTKLDTKLNHLAKKTVSEGIEYIRDVIGYKKYLQYYAEECIKVDPQAFYDYLDDILYSATDIDDYLQWEDKLQKFDMQLQDQLRNQKSLDRVTLTTMHSAKGLEFEYVYIVNAVDEVLPSAKCVTEHKIEEERRLFYVAATRAKNYLNIYLPKTFRNKTVRPTPFLEEMEGAEITIKIGDKIMHKLHGSGIIRDVKDKFARVEFQEQCTRRIDYKYCFKKRIIKLEEE